MSFFGDIPETAGKYLKLKQGENKIRILGPSISGSEGWTKVDGKKKPIRKRPGEAFTTGEVDETTLKYFWAVPVWNYALNKVQVFEMTQKSIMNALKKLSVNKSWGDPTGYDVVINREGEGMDTEYSVVPEPKGELEQNVKDEWERVKPSFDLNRLYDGADPFNPSLVKEESDEINIDEIPF